MTSAAPIRQDPGCEIDQAQGYMRATVGPGLADEVQACYRTLANECLVRQCKRILVIGMATIDPFYHLAVAYQEILFFPGPFNRAPSVLFVGALSVGVFLIGYWVFDRLRDSFAEAV